MPNMRSGRDDDFDDDFPSEDMPEYGETFDDFDYEDIDFEGWDGIDEDEY